MTTIEKRNSSWKKKAQKINKPPQHTSSLCTCLLQGGVIKLQSIHVHPPFSAEYHHIAQPARYSSIQQCNVWRWTMASWMKLYQGSYTLVCFFTVTRTRGFFIVRVRENNSLFHYDILTLCESHSGPTHVACIIYSIFHDHCRTTGGSTGDWKLGLRHSHWANQWSTLRHITCHKQHNNIHDPQLQTIWNLIQCHNWNSE